MKLIGEDNSYTRLVAQRSQSIPAEEFSGRAGISAITIHACREFPIVAKGGFHDSYTELVKYGTPPDPREFFIYRAVNEVFKSACSAIGWCGQILELLSKASVSDTVTIQVAADAIYNQQNLTVRKLFEVLIYCVLFSKTNETQYYKHLFHLFDLDQHLGRAQDSKEFFEKVSLFQDQQIEEIRNEILRMESIAPELSAAWYVSDDRKNRLKRPGKVLASSRRLYKEVSKSADLQLRTTLGHSYEVIFGSTSKWVHFMPSKIYSAGRTMLHDVVAHLAQQSLFEHAILTRSMDLGGLVPGEHCQAIKNTAMLDPEFLKQASEQVVLRKFAIGDYVLCTDTLFKVMETHQSQYGLLSCHVKPLAGHLTKEDWLPSSMLTVFAPDTKEHPVDDTAAIDMWREMLSQAGR